MKKLTLTLLATLCLTSISQVSVASKSMRCGNGLITKGDHQAEVVLLCGEPTYASIQEVYTSGVIYKNRNYTRTLSNDITTLPLLGRRGSVVLVPKEVWVYNFGSRKFIQEVTFINGQVSNIRSLGYGH